MVLRLRWIAIGDTTLIHHMGHGGSGAHPCPGDGRQALDLVLAAPGRGGAVLRWGAGGLASAWLLQRAGRPVRVYAERFSPADGTSWMVAAARWFPSQLLRIRVPHTRDEATWSKRWHVLQFSAFRRL